MRENGSDQHGLVLIKNLRNQAILIATDVKNHTVIYSVGVRVDLSDFSEVAPGRFARRFEPLMEAAPPNPYTAAGSKTLSVVFY
jgi:hypothetical protein